MAKFATKPPGVVASYLERVALAGPGALQNHAEITALDWSDIGCIPTLTEDGGIAVTRAEYGIAETG